MPCPGADIPERREVPRVRRLLHAEHEQAGLGPRQPDAEQQLRLGGQWRHLYGLVWKHHLPFVILLVEAWFSDQMDDCFTQKISMYSINIFGKSKIIFTSMIYEILWIYKNVLDKIDISNTTHTNIKPSHQ